MKYFIWIAIIISIVANAYFIYDEKCVKEKEEFGKLFTKAMGGEITTTTWKEGYKIFKQKLKTAHPKLATKKYYYINIWTNWCGPCIKEMPWLDSLVSNLRQDVAYIFVSDLTNKAASECIKRKKYQLKNFIFLNDMGDFVSGICNEQGIKNKSYPMVLIVNNKGEVIHYSNGAYENTKEAAEFATLINNLK